MDVNRQLVEAASSCALPVKLTGKPGRVTAEQLKSTLQLFKYVFTSHVCDVLGVHVIVLSSPVCLSVSGSYSQTDRHIDLNFGMEVKWRKI